MTSSYVDKTYAYAVARMRHAELKLLNAQAMEQLISAKDADEVLRALREKGWGDEAAVDEDAFLDAERGNLWQFAGELVPDLSVFNVFILPNDYNNLKAAIKESVLGIEYPGIYISECTVPISQIQDAIRDRSFGDLPTDMQEAAKEAHDTFLRTADGQLCDIIVDRACLDAIRKAGRETGNDFLDSYAELTVAAANIKTALRAARTGKDREFLKLAISECDTLAVNSLISAALSGEEGIISYLNTTEYASLAAGLKESPAKFERLCDNLVTEKSRSQLYESFGIGPIAAYILARENEIKSVRIIISGKKNGFSDEMIRERVRETYV